MREGAPGRSDGQGRQEGAPAKGRSGAQEGMAEGGKAGEEGEGEVGTGKEVEVEVEAAKQALVTVHGGFGPPALPCPLRICTS